MKLCLHGFGCMHAHHSEIICSQLWCHLEWCQTLERMDLEHWCQLEEHQTAFQPEDMTSHNLFLLAMCTTELMKFGIDEIW